MLQRYATNINSVTVTNCTVALTFPHISAEIIIFLLAPSCLKALTKNSLQMTIIAEITPSGAIIAPSQTISKSPVATSILSAIESRKVPKTVIKFLLLAIFPSRKSVNTATTKSIVAISFPPGTKLLAR